MEKEKLNQKAEFLKFLKVLSTDNIERYYACVRVWYVCAREREWNRVCVSVR